MKIALDTRLPREWYTRLKEYTLDVPFEQAEVLMTSFYMKVTREMISRMPNLKLVVQYGVGYDNIDVAACTERGILVTNTPYPVIEATAELCMTLMLALVRRVSELDRKMHANQCDFALMGNLGHSLYGKTLGIVGLGNIGQSVARRAVACGMKVFYYKRHRLPMEQEQTLGYTYRDLDELIAQSDIVSLNLPYTPAVHHLMDAKRLSMMKRDAYLINTARGPHVDELALAHALREKQIAGAAIDVFEHEPEVTEELRSLDNCIIVPHVGTATWECRREMAHDMEENILHWVHNELDQMTIVNRPQ